MPRFAANLSMLFPDVPFLARFERAARAGFRAVEFQFPYDLPAEEVARAMRDAGVEAVLHNLPAGDWARGDRGIAAHPARMDEFRDGVERGIAYARELGVPRLNALAGVAVPGVTAAEARAALVANLRHAAGRLSAHGLQLLVEPINVRDMPGFLLDRCDDAVAVLDEAGVAGPALQLDLYHLQRTAGELAGTLARLLPRVGHVQIADNPGRHEPGTGEIAWPFLFAELDRLGYAGWVGCEYRPADPGPGGTERGLAAWRAVAGF